MIGWHRMLYGAVAELPPRLVMLHLVKRKRNTLSGYLSSPHLSAEASTSASARRRLVVRVQCIAVRPYRVPFKGGQDMRDPTQHLTHQDAPARKYELT